MARPKGSTNKKGKLATTAPKAAKVTVEKPTKVKKEKVEKAAEKKKNVFLDMMNIAGNEWSGVAADGIEAGDINGFMDTGSFSLNALVSGKLKTGGFPDNKIVVLAGEEATGKTFFVLECIKRFLDTYPAGGIYFFETESAISKAMLIERGIDVKRIFWMPVSTVQELRTQAVKILDKYLTYDKEKRPPMMFVLDSLGMISTTKEITDTADGKETQDMTRARLIKSTFRVLTLKLGRAGVPFLVTNHTYDGQGLFATKEMSGGQGTKYAASITLFLSSRKQKEGDEVVGRIIRCTLKKGRLTKQDKQVEIALDFETGLNRYYGLLKIGEDQGVFTKGASAEDKAKNPFNKEKSKGKWNLGYGVIASESEIYRNPTKYFTDRIMEKLEVAAAKEFLYGSSQKTNAVSEVEELNASAESGS